MLYVVVNVNDIECCLLASITRGNRNNSGSIIKGVVPSLNRIVRNALYLVKI